MKGPNDLKLSDGGVRRGTCMVGGKAAAEAGAVTHGAVRCSAWLGRVMCISRHFFLEMTDAITMPSASTVHPTTKLVPKLLNVCEVTSVMW